MKKLILFLVLIMALPAYASFVNSADTPRVTFRNAYAWSGNIPQDKATLWAQEVEAKLEGETSSGRKLNLVSVSTDTTLTTGQSGSVVVVSGAATRINVTLPAAVAGLTYTIVDNWAQANADASVNPGSGDAIAGFAANLNLTSVTDVIGANITLIAVDTTTWAIVGASGTWTSD